ncbi:hypothetical protein RhiirC2_796677 [Rhizophagus irregularis]|uniref:Retrotransposon gag domain-containing protein n=1 Tax=Rhizophagus irregularis TaxID=588596 RepID=A0A2N1M997_9GLOM|nr:hypothetical protein RhiirC2_796677 [Rhizophagus irregularis]
MTRKQNRIGELVQEKFALQLLYQRNVHHLQRSRGNIGMAPEYEQFLHSELRLRNCQSDDSIPDFLAKLRLLYLQNQGVDPADNAGGPPTGREVAIGYLRGCMRGRALEWFDEEITTKQNWELANLLDNTGQANLVAVNGRNAGQIGNQALNEAFGQPGTAIVKLRAVKDP